MNKQAYTNIKQVVFYTITAIFLFVPASVIFANHADFGDRFDTPIRDPGPLGNSETSPCRLPDNLLDDRSVTITPGNLGNSSGKVPVYDEWVIRNLIALGEAIQRSYQFSELQDHDLQRTSEYLRLLCEKEYEEDHTIQHAWANIIGEFVFETHEFITTGLNGSPAFITSQEAYYQVVNIATARVFLQDVVDSPELGNDTKRDIIENVTRQMFAHKFPTDQQLADDDLPDDLAGDFYGTGGYPTFNQLLFDPDSNSAENKEQAYQELNTRINQQIEFEKEKLAWGRGFFSYEICDLAVYVQLDGEVNAEDRRNCRIATPGSLIQDQTSFVFGTALRQMEINDEYEEWIAPNTTEVLLDILSWRSLNSTDSRQSSVTNFPAAPSVSRDAVQGIDDYSFTVPGEGESIRQNTSGPLPYEFSQSIDLQLRSPDTPYGAFDPGKIGNTFFVDVLDPGFFLDQIN